jgi:hypothetical protein
MAIESTIIFVPERSSPFVPPAMRFMYVRLFTGPMIQFLNITRLWSMIVYG